MGRERQVRHRVRTGEEGVCVCVRVCVGWGKVGGINVMPDYHQRVMATLKFNVRLVNGVLLCIVKSIYNYRW